MAVDALQALPKLFVIKTHQIAKKIMRFAIVARQM